MIVKINNKKYTFQKGQTILELAHKNGINIPSLCYHPDLDIKAHCRICVVEIKGKNRLFTACSTKIEKGMEIYTESKKVIKSRNLNIEMIFSEHTKKCSTCAYLYDCDLLRLAREYKIFIPRFKNKNEKRKIHLFANAVEIDGTQCIDCGNCVEACNRQGISHLKVEGTGDAQEIKINRDNNSACIYCGQCAAHCPVTAAQEQYNWEGVEEIIKKGKKIVVVQFAPSVRVSIGEEFSLPYGMNCEGKINTALKKLGFSYIFDINFGADITTIVEAEELLERLGNKKAVFPMMTSCCPSWVAYVEYYHPELIPNLTSARSPHLHSAGAIKSYWAKKMKIKPQNIIVVSIVPCTAKKYEAARPELKFQGRPLVDYVLTTRELAFLIKRHNIDFKSLPDSQGEAVFNNGSGAAAIFGSSGGVMESALRSAQSLSREKNKNILCDKRLEFKEVRGMKDLKEASFNLSGKKIKVAVINGIGNFKKILPKLKQYHYVEVMACPGGCLGGGGQPIPTTDLIRKKRMEGMYNIDRNKKIRRAHENKEMKEYYSWVKENKLASQLLYTRFKKKKIK